MGGTTTLNIYLVSCVALFIYCGSADPRLGFFIRNVDNLNTTSQPLNRQSSWMNEITHLRLLPGFFPKGMQYHFDGLATLLSFEFSKGNLVTKISPYQSDLYRNYDSCIFEGSGTGPTLGNHLCTTNPAVNMLPIDGQLWLTIDTEFWGRVDLDTLETLPGTPNVTTLTLNAHPACDTTANICYVQHPCPTTNRLPLSNQACVSQLLTQPGQNTDLQIVELSRATLPEEYLLQHSHSPCVTPNYVVSKLDSFGARVNLRGGGVLEFLKQNENALWLVYDRINGTSRVMTSDVLFVNNHFWNCIETAEGVVVDTVLATSEYLDSYFLYELQAPPQWQTIFYKPQRCIVPFSGTAITCSDLFPNEDTLFDYPTFNPSYKMNPNFQYFYAISPKSTNSSWFDRIIKVNTQKRSIVSEFSLPGMYFTEADFIPTPASKGEDDGVLVSVAYNATSDKSMLLILNAVDLELVDSYPINTVIPFHAHGISCFGSPKKCIPNP